jgi:hypothetical protein
MDRTLGQILNMMNPDDLVKIGSESGSAFFYIGKVGDFYNGIDECQKYYINHMIEFMEKIREKREAGKRVEATSDEELEEKMRMYKKPLLERKVIDVGVADPIIESRRIVRIAIEGYELGRCWTSDECISNDGFCYELWSCRKDVNR